MLGVLFGLILKNFPPQTEFFLVFFGVFLGGYLTFAGQHDVGAEL